LATKKFFGRSPTPLPDKQTQWTNQRTGGRLLCNTQLLYIITTSNLPHIVISVISKLTVSGCPTGVHVIIYHCDSAVCWAVLPGIVVFPAQVTIISFSGATGHFHNGTSVQKCYLVPFIVYTIHRI